MKVQIPGRRAAVCLTMVVAAAMAPQGVIAQSANRSANQQILADKFEDQLAKLAWEAPGVMGISVIDIETGESYGVNQDLTFPTASSIKLLVEVGLYYQVARGKLRLDKVVSADFGESKNRYSLREVSQKMIDKSDNHATNILIEQVGMATINDLARQLGLRTMTLRRKMLDNDSAARGVENTATPTEAATFMVKFLTCDLPMPKATCEQMKEDAFKALPDGPVRLEVPPEIRVIQMPGGLGGVRNSWAAVDLPGKPFALGIMGHYGDFESITPYIHKVTAVSYDYFRRLAGSSEYGHRVGDRSEAAKPK